MKHRNVALLLHNFLYNRSMRTHKRGRRSISIKTIVRRTIALVLMLSFLVPSRAYALGMALDYGMQLFGGDGEQEEEPIVNEDATNRELAGEAAKRSLTLTGDETKKVRLRVAKTIAIATSEKIESLDMQVDAKTAKMQSSVRSLREKERSMQTIRWSPLFNIKFPTKPHEDESYEFEFKPVQLQNEITMLKHKIKETEMDINEKVSIVYIQIISAQNDIKTLEDRQRKLENTVAKLQVKVDDGTAALEQGVTETDEEGNEVAVSPRILKARLKQAKERLETAEKRLEACKTELANAKTKFEESKKKLSDIMGFDITTGYTFEDAFVTANLNRDMIEYLYAYAHDDDEGVYEAQMNYDEALLTLRLNYELCKKQYNEYIGALEPYIQQALDGEKVNKKAFKKDYDQFLKDIDEKWKGSYKIWFIRIPKEWLKGEIDGIRFIENDPYVLYSAVLDFESANKELVNAETDLHNRVYEEYSNYAASRKAYLAANNAYILAEKKLGLDEVSYLLGELSQEEFETEESEYNALKDDAASALKEFSDTLYSYDRTTWGGLTKFLEGAAQDKQSDVLSLVPVIRRGCIYTLRPIIDSEEFLLSIDVPDDFYAETGINITHFELYADGHQIGKRTPKDETIRHLSLSVKELGECAIRVYDGETFIDECRIEPTVFSGPLNITIGYEDDVDGHVLGTYVASDEVATNMLVLTLNFDQEEVRSEYENGNDAAYYRLTVADDTYLLSDRLVPVNEQFTYMSFVKGDLENVFLELFDKDMEEIGIAKFDTKSNEIYNDIDEDAAAELAAKKKQEAIERAAAQEEADARAAEEERKEAAIALLEQLNMPTDTASVLYAMKHLNQLAYTAELMEAKASLEREHELDEKKYEKLLQDPDADPKELKDLQDRLRITEKMPEIYGNTLSDEGKIIAKELEERKQLYIKELVAEYAKNYNESKGGEAANVSACLARMAEIETEVKEVYESDAIEVFKKDVIPFEEALTRMNAYSVDDFINSDRLNAFKSDYETCDGKIDVLEGKGYGSSFEPRLQKAAYKNFLIAKANMNSRDPNNPPSIYELTEDEFKTVEILNDSILTLQGYMAGSKYADETVETAQMVNDYYEALVKVEEERQKVVDEKNAIIQMAYNNLMSQDEADIRYKSAKSEYDTAKRGYDKEQSNIQSLRRKIDQLYAMNPNSLNLYFLEKQYNDSVDKSLVYYNQMKTAEEKVNLYKDKAEDNKTVTEKYQKEASDAISEIEKLHDTPMYTLDQLKSKATQTVEECVAAQNTQLNALYSSINEAKAKKASLVTSEKTAAAAENAQKTVVDSIQTELNNIQKQMDELRFKPREKQKLQPQYDEIKGRLDAATTKYEELKTAHEDIKTQMTELDNEVEAGKKEASSIIQDITLLGGTPGRTEAQFSSL